MFGVTKSTYAIIMQIYFGLKIFNANTSYSTDNNYA